MMRRPSLDEYDAGQGEGAFWAHKIWNAQHSPYDEEGPHAPLVGVSQKESLAATAAAAAVAAARAADYEKMRAPLIEEERRLRREAAKRRQEEADLRLERERVRREHYARELAAAQVAQSRAARWQQEAAAWRAAEESERLAHTARLLSGEINTCAEWGEGMHVVMTRDTDVRWNSWPPADEPKQTMLLGDVWNVGGQLGGALISHGWAQKL